MKDIATYSRTNEIIEKYDFNFKKSFGQNFIIDPNILKKIVSKANITKETVVIEIGPGIGALTEQLAKSALKVFAFEIDKRLIPILSETLEAYNNIEIINQDVLKVNIKEFVETNLSEYKDIVVVANLPYYITTPILMHFLENKVNIDRYILMMQKEVAERLSAKPNTKAYNSLSIAVQYYTETSIVTTVPRTVFKPQPNVDSAVIKLQSLGEKKIKVSNEDMFFRVVKGSFVQRRKTIYNNLATSFNNVLTKQQITDILQEASIEPSRRGESLAIEEFVKLSNIVFDKLNGND